MPATDLSIFIHDYKAAQRNNVEQIENEHYLSVKEYAERTQRSPVTVRQMCANGRIEGAVKNGKSWLIPVKETSDITRLREENIRLVKENAKLRGIISSIIAVARTE